MFLISFALSLAFPLADALIMSALISFLWILKRNTKPTWYLTNFMEDEQEQPEQKIQLVNFVSDGMLSYACQITTKKNNRSMSKTS